MKAAEAAPRRRLIVAIDGPSGVGKTTVSKAVASRLGIPYLGTGAMYRAIALKVLEEQGLVSASGKTIVVYGARPNRSF